MNDESREQYDGQTIAIEDDDVMTIETDGFEENGFTPISLAQLLGGSIGQGSTGRYTEDGEYKGNLSDEEFNALPIIDLEVTNQVTGLSIGPDQIYNDDDAVIAEFYERHFLKLLDDGWLRNPDLDILGVTLGFSRIVKRYRINGGEWSTDEPEELSRGCCGQDPAFRRGTVTELRAYIRAEDR